MGGALFETFLVLARTLAYIGLEGGAEVALAGKSCHVGNFSDAEI
jgi:hypothetical protein